MNALPEHCVPGFLLLLRDFGALHLYYTIVLLLLEGSGFLFILPIKLVEIPIASTHTASKAKATTKASKTASVRPRQLLRWCRRIKSDHKKIILSSLCRTALIVSSLLNNVPKKVCSWVYYPKEIKFFSDQTICCCYWEVVSAANCRWVPDTGLIRWSLFFTSGCESGYLINGLIVCYLFHLQSYLFLWWYTYM